MTALIIAGGEYAALPSGAFDYVIACDRGYLYAQEMGIRPDLIIGDFDSAPPPKGEIPVEKYPSVKDDTDTMLAVKKALLSGYDEITIACAFGGRLDHTVANIQSGAYIAEHGGIARLVGNGTEAFIFRNRERTFQHRKNCYLSVFSLRDTSVISIAGAEYSGDRICLTSSFPVGVSNIWAAQEVRISVHEGTVMVMICDAV